MVGEEGTVNKALNGWLEDDEPVNLESLLGMLMYGSGCDMKRSIRLAKTFFEERREDGGPSNSQLT